MLYCRVVSQVGEGRMFEYFKDSFSVSYQFQRTLAEMGGSGAALGECDWVGRQLLENFSYTRWIRLWTQLAERIEGIATNCEAHGHPISARDAFLRATNYYRTAEFFCPPSDARKIHLYTASLRCFERARPHLPFQVERVEVPYDGVSLAGYFVHGKNASGRTGVVILIGGFDSTAEEIYILGGPAVAERGFHCFIFDGPGQGYTLRTHGIPTLPEYERPVSAAIDYLATRDDVDAARIAVSAFSLGGYYGPRAAAHDARLRACVAWGALVDFKQVILEPHRRAERVAQVPDRVLAGVARVGGRFDARLRQLRDVPMLYQWGLGQLLWILGVSTVNEALDKLDAFNLRGVVEKIECPLLIMHGEADHLIPIAQAYEMYARARCPKHLKVFTAEEGADDHCMIGNLPLATQVMSDWVEDVLRG
jgi:pimeloyl-ACP methyl ester carboxylesterase